MNKRLITALLAGFMVGTLWLVLVRFVTFEDKRTHYHANFAMYINGQRDPFESSTFYEETQSCSADEVGPRSRVHLHDQKSSVVHVHDEGATWGHLFANLGYSLGNKSLQTDKGVFVDGTDENELTFVLNGKKLDGVANEVIRSEDVLLINYGRDDQNTLGNRLNEIAKDAKDYNQKSDPSSCSGSKPVTFTQRLKHAIGVRE